MLFGHGEAAVVRLPVGQGGACCTTLSEGYPEIVVDADNEAGIRGVAMFAGRPI